MYYSIVRYVADGTTKIFSVPFDYLEKEFVKVYVDDVEQEITWVSDTQIEFRNPPPAGSIVAIQRETPKYRLVDFKQASILDPETLDRDGNQLVHIVQESLDKSEDALRKDVDDKYDASGKVIKNVARPKDPTDAVNKEYADEIINRASQEANRAKTEADRATTQANLAESAADTAGAHASSAASSANSAAQSASNAAAARDKAELWANAGENVEVEPGKYSAYHWAMRASYSAGESVKAIDGVQGDGGNIDLIAGTGVVITPDPVNKRITIGTNITPELIGAETPAGAQEKADAVQSALDTHKSSGDHDDRYYTKSQLNTSGGGGAVHWDNVTNKPSTFPPQSHTHTWDQITGKPSVYPPDLSNVNIDSLIDVTKFFHKLTPSNVQRAAHTSETFTTWTSSPSRVVTWNVFGFGEVKVTCELRTTSSNYPAQVRVGSGSDSSSYTSRRTTSTSYVSMELTRTVQPSHVSTSFEAPVWVEIKVDADKNDHGYRTYIRNIRLYYS